MASKDKKESYCLQAGESMGCCKVESVISIDERGQMVLPKETREKANIYAGDKLALKLGKGWEDLLHVFNKG